MVPARLETGADQRPDPRPPAYVLVVHNDVMPWMTMRPYDSATELAYYPELAGLLRSRYRPAGRIEDFNIWERPAAESH